MGSMGMTWLKSFKAPDVESASASLSPPFDTIASQSLKVGIEYTHSGFVHMNENPIGMRGLSLGMW